MLYVFHVDTGTMMTFDMSLALGSVANLKEAVENACKIPADKQVLLISGGESLDPFKSVCSYSAGTDTNPIFLFSKCILEAPAPPPPSIDYGSEKDLQEKLIEYCDMPATLNTVTRRAQLAQQFHELAREQTILCEKLVHEQHLQQQGWFAVVANLDDVVIDFQKRIDIFEKSFNEYMAERETYLTFLTHFNDDLVLLQKIPVLPALLELYKQNSEVEAKALEDNVSTSQETESTKEVTLFEWMAASDNKSSMDQIYHHCSRGLEQFDAQTFKNIRKEISDLLTESEKGNMKEIKGLGERLSGLEHLMREAKIYVQQQADLAQSFLKNQSRASNMKDQSILPDLCASHRKQLQLIAHNHQQLCDIRRRTINAKEELGANLYVRLRWVMYVEGQIADLDGKLMIYHENLKRLRLHLVILQQIHMAPATYLCAITEVVRRREFSQSFLLWASELACHLLTIYNEEVTRRKEFQAQFEGHFLTTLFPGMEDMPPTFATQAPSMFDSILPKITVDDVERLKCELPELEDNLNIPDISAVTNFFLIRSVVKKEEEKLDETRAVEENLVQAVSEVGLGSKLDHNLLKGTGSELCLTTAHGLPHLKDLDRGCESETDTEEFEKVGQSPLELTFDKQIKSPRPGTQDASTSTEVGERSPIPPKKPPRAFQKSHLQSSDDPSISLQRTLSVSSTQSNTESFTNIKNPSLESIDELSSLKNLTSNTESCFNSHYQQLQSYAGNLHSRSKSISPHTPQSPKDVQANSPNSPVLGHQPSNDFISDEFYIDESLPSSLSIETGNSQGEFVKQLDTANNVVALLQDNLQISRSEHDKLKSLVVRMHDLAKEATYQLKFELKEMRFQVLSDKKSVSEHYESLSSSWENLILEKDTMEKELVESIKRDYELTVSDLKKTEKEKDEQIENLLMQKSTLELEVIKSSDNLNELRVSFDKQSNENEKKVEELQKQLYEKELEKDKSIKEITDRLNREHKAELENIRSRFKLMTMERSPSETNLEKSNEFSSLPSHSTLLMQMTENFELDKEKAVDEALKKENDKWETLLSDKLKEMEAKFEEEKELLIQDVAKKISDEKEKQIDVLRERERNLNLECVKYKSTIQQLAECETESHDSELMERIDTLQREKERLEEELEKFKNERGADLNASVAVYEDKVDATTSPIKERDIMSKSEISITRSGKLNIDSCKAGDQVVVLWDAAHESFKILQESKHMYFLHSDYLEALGLEVVDGKPNKVYCTGEVVDKEYCHARKSENRYKVPKGTKFFRVKVKSVEVTAAMKDLTQSMYHSITTLSDSCKSIVSSTITTIMEVPQDAMEVLQDATASDSLNLSPPRERLVPSDKCDKKEETYPTNPKVSRLGSTDRSVGEDSGIVDNTEQAAAEQGETFECETSDRFEKHVLSLVPSLEVKQPLY